MSQEEKETEYIKNRVENQIEYFNDKAKLEKKAFYFMSILRIIVSVSITILSGIFFDNVIGYIVTILSGIISIVDFLLMLFKTNEKWIIYRSASESLVSELFKYKANSNSDFDSFVETIESILNRTNNKWICCEKKKEGK